MNDWMIPLLLAIAALSLAAIGVVCCRCRRIVRNMNRRIAQAVREQDRFAREKERVRIEKEELERMLPTKHAVSDGCTPKDE